MTDFPRRHISIFPVILSIQGMPATHFRPLESILLQFPVQAACYSLWIIYLVHERSKRATVLTFERTERLNGTLNTAKRGNSAVKLYGCGALGIFSAAAASRTVTKKTKFDSRRLNFVQFADNIHSHFNREKRIKHFAKMPSTLESCEKYYGTRDIYKLFEITKDTLEKDSEWSVGCCCACSVANWTRSDSIGTNSVFVFTVKKAYYRLSLLVHPDRVSEDEKEIATEKFKILTKLHGILTDKDKKALYDEQGIIDDDSDSGISWLEKWRQFFKPITTTDIDNFKKEYIGE